MKFAIRHFPFVILFCTVLLTACDSESRATGALFAIRETMPTPRAASTPTPNQIANSINANATAQAAGQTVTAQFLQDSILTAVAKRTDDEAARMVGIAKTQSLATSIKLTDAGNAALATIDASATAYQSIINGEKQKQQLRDVVSEPSNRTATAQFVLTQQAQRRSIETWWTVVDGLAYLIIATILCGAVGYSLFWNFVLRRSAETLEVRMIKAPDGREHPHTWRVDPLGRARLDPIVIENMPLLNKPANETRDNAERLNQLKFDWMKSILECAHAASRLESWQVSALSNRLGGTGVLTEDALADIARILITAGYLVNRGGNKGVGWAREGGLIDLGRAMEDGVFTFDIPTRRSPTSGDLEYKPAPLIALSNATQRNAATHDDAEKAVKRGNFKKRTTTPQEAT